MRDIASIRAVRSALPQRSTAEATMRSTARWLALCAVFFLCACVYVPRMTRVYDHECKVMARQLVLEGGQVAAIQRCENQGCVALIVGAGAVTAVTLVVSGSIVVVGNIAYWLERKAQCRSES